MRFRAVQFILLFVALLGPGCAFVDQRLDLTYEPSVKASGGSGTIFLAKPVVTGIPKQGSDWIIGSVRNGVGQQTASVVTGSDIGDWINGALIRELGGAGYRIEPVALMPGNAVKGIQVTVAGLFVDDDIQLQDRVAGAYATVSFQLELWKDGMKVKTLNISARGGEQYEGFFSPEKRNSALKKALRSAMQQSLPEIIGTLER